MKIKKAVKTKTKKKIVKRKVQVTNKVKKSPLDTLNAWIKPDGKFIKLDYGEHSWILNKEDVDYDKAEKEGWIHLSGGYFDVYKKKPSQRQLNIIFDWCMRHDRDFDKFLTTMKENQGVHFRVRLNNLVE
jgi:hypothetical protein